MNPRFTVTSGSNLRCKGWRQEGILRLLENVLAVGEDPANLVVYAALGKAARDWPSHDKIVDTLRTMNEDETLIVQSGKPIGLIRTHDKAPIVILANCNMVGQWAKAENFYEWQKQNSDLLGWAYSWCLAIHRLAGCDPGHLRNLHAHCGAAFWRQSRRTLHLDCRPRRHGRRAATRGIHGRRCYPMR